MVGALQHSPAQQSPTPGARSLQAWILRHDESWWFIGAYVGLAVVLSLAISLFWLVAVVAVHGFMEVLRQRWTHPQPPGSMWLRVAWELKLDLALILFALALAAYMDVVLGVAGIGGAARLGAQAGARVGARATGWSRALRGALLSLDDVAQVGRAVVGRSDPPDGMDNGEFAVGLPPWRDRWGWGDHLAVWGGLAFVALLLAAPWLTPHDPASLLTVLGEELHPLP